MANTLYAELQQAAHDMFLDAPLSEYLKAVTDGLYDTLLSNVNAKPDREVIASTEYRLLEGAISNVWRSTQLIVHLVKLYECQQAIELASQKEVNNG